MKELDDDGLAASFADGTLPPSAFNHEAHIRVAWLYLKREPFLAAASRFSEDLQRFAAKAGAPGKYHETVTVAYLAAIAERLGEAAEAWGQFIERNREILHPDFLKHYYTPDVLSSDLARRTFVLSGYRSEPHF